MPENEGIVKIKVHKDVANIIKCGWMKRREATGIFCHQKVPLKVNCGVHEI